MKIPFRPTLIESRKWNGVTKRRVGRAGVFGVRSPPFCSWEVVFCVCMLHVFCTSSLETLFIKEGCQPTENVGMKDSRLLGGIFSVWVGDVRYLVTLRAHKQPEDKDRNRFKQCIYTSSTCRQRRCRRKIECFKKMS